MNIAQTNADIFLELDKRNRSFFDTASRFRKKYYKSPFTDKMEKDIRDSGLEPVYVNIIQPFVKTLVGMMYSNKNSATAIPNGADSKYAYIWQALITACFQMNHWPQIYRRILTDQMISGIGFAAVDRDDSFNPNPLGVKLKYVDYEKCRWSTNFSMPMMDDLDMFAYYSVMTIKAAMVKTGAAYDRKMIDDVTGQMYTLPNSLSDVNVFNNLGSRGYQRTENALVPYIECFRKDFKNYQKLLFYNQDKSKIVRSELIPVGKDQSGEPYTSYQNVLSYFYDDKDEGKFAKDKVEEIKKLGKLTSLKLERIVKTVSVGGYSVGQYELPTDKFPFVPFIYDMQEGGYPVGAVESIEGVNTQINQILLLHILNARLQCNFHVLSPTGAIKNVDAFSMQMSKAGSIIEYDAVTIGNAAQPLIPQPMYAQQLPTTLADLVKMLLDIAQLNSSVTDAIQGTPSSPDQSGAAIQQLQSFGGLKFKPHAESNQMSIARVAEIAVDYIKEFSTYDKIVRYKEDDSSFVKTVADQNSNPIQSMQNIHSSDSMVGRKVTYPGYNIEMPINYRMQVNGEIQYVNDVKNAECDVDFIITASPSVESARQVWLSILENWMRQMPQIANILGPKALKLADFPDADKLSEEIDTVNQLQQQLDAVTKQLEISKSEQVRLMQQNLRSKTGEDTIKITSEYKMQLDKVLNEIKLFAKTLEQNKDNPQAVSQSSEKFRQDMAEIDSLLQPQVPEQSAAQVVENTLPK